MKLKTSHLIVGCIAILALSQGENVRSSINKGDRIRQEQSEFSDRIRANKQEARQAEKLSGVALDRYKNNCILVSDRDAGKESYFWSGESVLDKQLKRPIRTGAAVCNGLGDTAVVSADGTIADIARIALPDMAKFKQLMQQRKK